MADDERTEVVGYWPDLIAYITKVIQKTRHGRLKTQILDLDTALQALHSKARDSIPRLTLSDTDDARLRAAMSWPALVLDISKVVARTHSSLHANDIFQLDDLFFELHDLMAKIPADGIEIHHSMAPKSPPQVSSSEMASPPLCVSPSIRNLIAQEASDDPEGSIAETDPTPSGKLADRPKVPGIIHNIRPKRNHGFQYPQYDSVYKGKLFDDIEFERTEKKPKIISAPEGSTGLINEFALPMEQRISDRSLGDALQQDMRSRFGINHERKPSIYTHGSRILILWSQEDRHRGLTAPDQPAFFHFSHLSLIHISPFIRNLLHEKESGLLNDIDFHDKIVYDPDYTMNRKERIRSVTVYLDGLLNSGYARQSNTYNAFATQMTKMEIWDGLRVLATWMDSGHVDLVDPTNLKELDHKEKCKLRGKHAILIAKFLDITETGYLDLIEVEIRSCQQAS